MIKAKVIFLASLLLSIIAMFAVVGSREVKAEQRNRFEISFVTHPTNGDSDERIHVLHDWETGQEIVCFSRYGGALTVDSYAMSCWPTGRSWKRDGTH